jgi:hypothetical protein
VEPELPVPATADKRQAFLQRGSSVAAPATGIPQYNGRRARSPFHPARPCRGDRCLLHSKRAGVQRRDGMARPDPSTTARAARAECRSGEIEVPVGPGAIVALLSLLFLIMVRL